MLANIALQIDSQGYGKLQKGTFNASLLRALNIFRAANGNYSVATCLASVSRMAPGAFSIHIK